MARSLQDWFNNGSPPLQSAAASDVIAVLHRLGIPLTCPLIRCYFEDAQAQGSRVCDLLMTTSARLFEWMLPGAQRKWGTQIARIPLTEDETKKFCYQKYSSDETVAVGLFCTEGSVASSIYGELYLTRGIIKEILTRLHNNRRKQTVFAGFICATRFKALTAEGTLQLAKCMRCGGQDSFSHLLARSGLGPPPDEGSPEELLEYLMAFVREAVRGAPVAPIKFALPEVDEISLTAEDNTSDMELPASEASMDSLSFELSEEEN